MEMRVKKSLHAFPSKGWSSNGFNSLLRQTDAH